MLNIGLLVNEIENIRFCAHRVLGLRLCIRLVALLKWDTVLP